MDHAGIATQAKVDAAPEKPGHNPLRPRPREVSRVAAWSWKEEYAKVIREQWQAHRALARLPARALHAGRRALRSGRAKSSSRLYEKGLIYRGERIINWDVEAKTALSNIEIEHVDDRRARSTTSRYPFADGTPGGITVATTRPETMFGDVALMVHPDDERYRQPDRQGGA
ncbi:MAG: class I tRNA ligase family protein [Bacillus subtilis]|nr:class I tRNA ligase family protein [Bacillus subtilis]